MSTVPDMFANLVCVQIVLIISCSWWEHAGRPILACEASAKAKGKGRKKGTPPQSPSPFFFFLPPSPLPLALATQARPILQMKKKNLEQYISLNWSAV